MSKTTVKTFEIALYGNRQAGFDFLADEPLADGDVRFFEGSQPSPEVLRFGTATEALWSGLRTLQDGGAEDGSRVVVYQDGAAGPRSAILTLGDFPYFGSITWGPAPVVEIQIDDLLQASE